MSNFIQDSSYINREAIGVDGSAGFSQFIQSYITELDDSDSLKVDKGDSVSISTNVTAVASSLTDENVSDTGVSNQQKFGKIQKSGRGYVLNEAFLEMISEKLGDIDEAFNDYLNETRGLGKSVNIWIEDLNSEIEYGFSSLDPIAAVKNMAKYLESVDRSSFTNIDSKYVNVVKNSIDSLITSINSEGLAEIGQNKEHLAIFSGEKSLFEESNQKVKDALSDIEFASLYDKSTETTSFEQSGLKKIQSEAEMREEIRNIAQNTEVSGGFIPNITVANNEYEEAVSPWTLIDDTFSDPVLKASVDQRNNSVLEGIDSGDKLSIFSAIVNDQINSLTYESEIIENWERSDQLVSEIRDPKSGEVISWEGKGDCDGIAIDTVTRLRNQGLNAIVAVKEGHAEVLVKDPSGSWRKLNIAALVDGKELQNIRSWEQLELVANPTKEYLFTFDDKGLVHASKNTGDLVYGGVNGISVASGLAVDASVFSEERILGDKHYTVDELFGSPKEIKISSDNPIDQAYVAIANSINRAYFNMQCSVFAMLNQGITPAKLVEMLNKLKDEIAKGAINVDQGKALMKSFGKGRDAGLLLEALQDPSNYKIMLEGAWGSQQNKRNELIPYFDDNYGHTDTKVEEYGDGYERTIKTFNRDYKIDWDHGTVFHGKTETKNYSIPKAETLSEKELKEQIYQKIRDENPGYAVHIDKIDSVRKEDGDHYVKDPNKYKVSYTIGKEYSIEESIAGTDIDPSVAKGLQSLDTFKEENLGDLGLGEADLGPGNTVFEIDEEYGSIDGAKVEEDDKNCIKNFKVTVNPSVQRWAKSIEHESWTQNATWDKEQMKLELGEYYDEEVCDPTFGDLSFKELNYKLIDQEMQRLKSSMFQGIGMAMIGEVLQEVPRMMIQYMFGVEYSKTKVFTSKRYADFLSSVLKDVDQFTNDYISKMGQFNNKVFEEKVEQAKDLAAEKSRGKGKKADAYESMMTAKYQTALLHQYKTVQKQMITSIDKVIDTHIDRLNSSENSFDKARGKVLSKLDGHDWSIDADGGAGKKQLDKEFAIRVSSDLQSIKYTEMAKQLTESAARSSMDMIIKFLLNMDVSSEITNTLVSLSDAIATIETSWVSRIVSAEDMVIQLDNSIQDAEKAYEDAKKIYEKMKSSGWMSVLGDVLSFVAIAAAVAPFCGPFIAAGCAAVSAGLNYAYSKQIMDVQEDNLSVDFTFDVNSLSKQFMEFLEQSAEKSEKDKIELKKMDLDRPDLEITMERVADSFNEMVGGLWALVGALGNQDLVIDKGGGFVSADAKKMAEIRTKMLGFKFQMLAITMVAESIFDVHDIVMQVMLGVKTKSPLMQAMQGVINSINSMVNDAADFQSQTTYMKATEHNRERQQQLDLKRIQHAKKSAVGRLAVSLTMAVVSAAAGGAATLNLISAGWAAGIAIGSSLIGGGLNVLNAMGDLQFAKDMYHNYNKWEEDTGQALLIEETERSDLQRSDVLQTEYQKTRYKVADALHTISNNMIQEINRITFENSTIDAGNDFVAMNPVQLAKTSEAIAKFVNQMLALFTVMKSANDSTNIVLAMMTGINIDSGFKYSLMGVQAFNAFISNNLSLRIDQLSLDISAFNRKVQAKHQLDDAKEAMGNAITMAVINTVIAVASAYFKNVQNENSGVQIKDGVKQAAPPEVDQLGMNGKPLTQTNVNNYIDARNMSLACNVASGIAGLFNQYMNVQIAKKRLARETFGDLEKFQVDLMKFFDELFDKKDDPYLKTLRAALSSMNNSLLQSTANGRIGLNGGYAAELRQVIDDVFTGQKAIIDAKQSSTDAKAIVMMMMMRTPGNTENFQMSRIGVELWHSAVNQMLSFASQSASRYAERYNARVQAAEALAVTQAKALVSALFTSLNMAGNVYKMSSTAAPKDVSTVVNLMFGTESQGGLGTMGSFMLHHVVKQFATIMAEKVARQSFAKKSEKKAKTKFRGGALKVAAGGKYNLRTQLLSMSQLTGKSRLQNMERSIRDSHNRTIDRLFDDIIFQINMIATRLRPDLKNETEKHKTMATAGDMPVEQSKSPAAAGKQTLTPAAAEKTGPAGKKVGDGVAVPVEGSTKVSSNGKLIGSEQTAKEGSQAKSESQKGENSVTPTKVAAATNTKIDSTSGKETPMPLDIKDGDISKLATFMDKVKDWIPEGKLKMILDEVADALAKLASEVDSIKDYVKSHLSNPTVSAPKLSRPGLTSVDASIQYNNPDLNAGQRIVSVVSDTTNTVLNELIKLKNELMKNDKVLRTASEISESLSTTNNQLKDIVQALDQKIATLEKFLAEQPDNTEIKQILYKLKQQKTEIDKQVAVNEKIQDDLKKIIVSIANNVSALSKELQGDPAAVVQKISNGSLEAVSQLGAVSKMAEAAQQVASLRDSISLPNIDTAFLGQQGVDVSTVAGNVQQQDSSLANMSALFQLDATRRDLVTQDSSQIIKSIESSAELANNTQAKTAVMVAADPSKVNETIQVLKAMNIDASNPENQLKVVDAARKVAESINGFDTVPVVQQSKIISAIAVDVINRSKPVDIKTDANTKAVVSFQQSIQVTPAITDTDKASFSQIVDRVEKGEAIDMSYKQSSEGVPFSKIDQKVGQVRSGVDPQQDCDLAITMAVMAVKEGINNVNMVFTEEGEEQAHALIVFDDIDGNKKVLDFQDRKEGNDLVVMDYQNALDKGLLDNAVVSYSMGQTDQSAEAKVTERILNRSSDLLQKDQVILEKDIKIKGEIQQLDDGRKVERKAQTKPELRLDQAVVPPSFVAPEKSDTTTKVIQTEAEREKVSPDSNNTAMPSMAVSETTAVQQQQTVEAVNTQQLVSNKAQTGISEELVRSLRVPEIANHLKIVNEIIESAHSPFSNPKDIEKNLMLVIDSYQNILNSGVIQSSTLQQLISQFKGKQELTLKNIKELNEALSSAVQVSSLTTEQKNQIMGESTVAGKFVGGIGAINDTVTAIELTTAKKDKIANVINSSRELSAKVQTLIKDHKLPNVLKYFLDNPAEIKKEKNRELIVQYVLTANLANDPGKNIPQVMEILKGLVYSKQRKSEIVQGLLEKGWKQAEQDNDSAFTANILIIAGSIESDLFTTDQVGELGSEILRSFNELNDKKKVVEGLVDNSNKASTKTRGFYEQIISQIQKQNKDSRQIVDDAFLRGSEISSGGLSVQSSTFAVTNHFSANVGVTNAALAGIQTENSIELNVGSVIEQIRLMRRELDAIHSNLTAQTDTGNKMKLLLNNVQQILDKGVLVNPQLVDLVKKFQKKDKLNIADIRSIKLALEKGVKDSSLTDGVKDLILAELSSLENDLSTIELTSKKANDVETIINKSVSVDEKVTELISLDAPEEVLRYFDEKNILEADRQLVMKYFQELGNSDFEIYNELTALAIKIIKDSKSALAVKQAMVKSLLSEEIPIE